MKGELYLYADDITILYSEDNLGTIENNVNNDMIQIQQWMAEHKLTLNTEKTKYMLFAERQNVSINIKYNNINITKTNEFKYLGIIFDNNLTWHLHLQYIKSKLVPLTGIFRKISKYTPFKSKRTIFYALFHPYVLYGLPIWGSACKTNMDQIQKLQNRALKNLYNMPFRTPTSKVHKETEVLKIIDSYFISSVINIHNILNSQTNSNININTEKQKSLRNDHQIRNIKVNTTKHGINGVLHSAIAAYNSLEKEQKELTTRKLKEQLKKEKLQKL